MTREQLKIEAIARMKLLKLHNNPIKEFMEEDVVNLSENDGILFWLDEKQMEYVKAFERKYDLLVYHVIHNVTEFGELLSFLYVSDSSEEWERERDELKDGYAYAYVKNMDDSNCSEFGGINIKPRIGGLVRTE